MEASGRCRGRTRRALGVAPSLWGTPVATLAAVADDRWFVYLVRCADGSLYCGVTTDIPRRLEDHDTGRGARYTRGRGPVELVASAGPMSRAEALRLELRIKRARRAQKERLLADEPASAAQRDA